MTVRRRVLGTLGAAALGALLPRPAAAAKVWRVGLLDGRPRGDKDGMVQPFVKAMRDLGYAEGRDIEYVERYIMGGASWESQSTHLVGIAHELVRSRLDAIVASGTFATKTLQRATTTIPIVTNVGDPVGAGFAKSLARPGGNITGVALQTTYAKAFQHLKAIIPGDWTFAIADGDQTRDVQSLISAVEEGARANAIPIRAMSLKGMDAGQADRSLASMRRQGIRVLLALDRIAGIPDEGYDLLMATKYGLVTAKSSEDEVAKGALMSYDPDGEGTEARKAFQLARILRGTPPGEIPFETPTTFRLTVNRKTAKILGLTIPREILILADKIYE